MTVAVAQLYIHYVEYSAMCNCALREVQTGLSVPRMCTAADSDYIIVLVYSDSGLCVLVGTITPLSAQSASRSHALLGLTKGELKI